LDQAQDRDGASIGRAETFNALHRGGLASAVGSDQTKYFPRLNVERDVVQSDGPTVGLPDSGNVNSRLSRHGGLTATYSVMQDC
jgi:hypothetical protein